MGLTFTYSRAGSRKGNAQTSAFANHYFSAQILDRDLSGGRKRKLPNKTLSTYSSKPVKEPLMPVSHFDNLAANLNKSKCQSTLLLAIEAGKRQ